jgi:hypothetical protein
MSGPAEYANSGGIIYSHYDTHGCQTHVVVDGVKLAVYPVAHCTKCDGDRPHHGPFCMSCAATDCPVTS